MNIDIQLINQMAVAAASKTGEYEKWRDAANEVLKLKHMYEELEIENENLRKELKLAKGLREAYEAGNPSRRNGTTATP